MRRMLIATSALFAASLAMAGSAWADEAPAKAGGERINMLIVYGEDPCPASTGNDITVCARKDEDERNRLPAPFRGSDSPQNEAWTNKVIAYERVGASGAQSCSATGAAGWTGCSNKLIDDAYAEKKASSDVQFSKMIQAEREKRLATVDAEAAATQSDVEQIERVYEMRKQAEAAKKP